MMLLLLLTVNCAKYATTVVTVNYATVVTVNYATTATTQTTTRTRTRVAATTTTTTTTTIAAVHLFHTVPSFLQTGNLASCQSRHRLLVQ